VEVRWAERVTTLENINSSYSDLCKRRGSDYLKTIDIIKGLNNLHMLQDSNLISKDKLQTQLEEKK